MEAREAEREIREVVVPVLTTNPEADRIVDDLFARRKPGARRVPLSR